MNRLPMHEALKPLAWLEGTWLTQSLGSGKFPTIKPFQYCEEIKFTSIGQPMFNYIAQSWHPETKMPMHRESGVLKVIPDTNRVALILSHNLGLATIEEGEMGDDVINLKSTSITRQTVGAKPPVVTELQREFKLIGEQLQHVLCMATSATPELTEHLRSVYVKQQE